MFDRTVRRCLVLCSIGISFGVAAVQAIMEINGNIPAFTLTSPSPFTETGAILGVSSGSAITTNLDTILGPFPTTFGPLNIFRIPFVSGPGVISFNVGPALTVGAVKDILNLPGGGGISFDLFDLVASVIIDPASLIFNKLTITGKEEVDFVDPSVILDFNAFNRGDITLEKAHPAVPGWSICSIRVPCAGDLRRARGGTGWRGRDR